MSAVVKCAALFGDSIEIGALEGYPDAPRIYVQTIARGAVTGNANPTRADFLAAVSSELGVVIIDKADLPIVTERGVPDAVFVGDTPWHRGTGWDVAAIRKSALDRLALADYLERNPPVDEAQVSALREVMDAANANGYVDFDDLARKVIATGKVEVRS